MFLKGVILLLTAWFLGLFLWVALQRFTYPFELHAGEASVIEAAFKILDGGMLYGLPSLQWFPISQTPLFYYLSALLMESSQLYSIVIMRMLTIGSTVGIGLILYRFLRKTGIDDVFSLVGFGLFFAAYSSVDQCYDLAVPNMLAAFLGLLAVYFSGLNKKNLTVLLCALTTVLAVFTDQTYLILWVLLLIHWFFQGRKKFYIYAFTTVIFILFGLYALHFLNEGKSWYCLFEMPLHKELYFHKLFTFWFVDLFWLFPIMSITAVLALFGLGRILYRKSFKQSDMSMSVMVIGFFSVSLITVLHEPTSIIAMVPAVIALAGLTSWTLQHFHLNDYDFGWLPSIVVKILVIIQMALLVYNPQPLIPDLNDKEQGKSFIDFLASAEGDVFIPNHPYYTRLAGKKPHLSGGLLSEYIKIKVDEVSGIPADAIEAVSSKSFTLIVLDEPIDYWIDVIAPYYLQDGRFFEGKTEFYTKSGYKIRPQFIYKPE